MKVSIGGFSFFNTMKEGKMDIYGYLETVKYRYRMNVVDLWTGFYITDTIDRISILPDESEIKKIREALDEKEMTVVNIAIDGAHLWDPDPDKRERLYQNALKHLRAAEILGAKTVRIDTGGSYSSQGSDEEFTQMSDEQFEYIVKRYQEYSKRAADNGYMIGPENHTGPSLNPHLMKKIAEAVDHPNYGILLHMGRWKVDAEIGDGIVAPWVYHTHFDAKTAKADNAVEMVNMLVNAGFDGYWGIEHNAPENQYLEMEWAIAAVKRILKSAEANR